MSSYNNKVTQQVKSATFNLPQPSTLSQVSLTDDGKSNPYNDWIFLWENYNDTFDKAKATEEEVAPPSRASQEDSRTIEWR